MHKYYSQILIRSFHYSFSCYRQFRI